MFLEVMSVAVNYFKLKDLSNEFENYFNVPTHRFEVATEYTKEH